MDRLRRVAAAVHKAHTQAAAPAVERREAGSTTELEEVPPLCPGLGAGSSRNGRNDNTFNPV